MSPEKSLKFPNLQKWFLNYYFCSDCEVEWSDKWMCASDDDCPECGKDTEPYESVPVTHYLH